MSRIRRAFERAREENRAALVTYLCAGDPSLELTSAYVEAMAAGGADVIELGVPFSDPTADGPSIQRASERALRAGTTLASALEIVRRARRTTDVPILLFGYYNPILSYGEGRFAVDAGKAGADGALVVDLPPEECHELRGALVDVGLDFIPLLAPTSGPAREAGAREVATAFIYYVSMTGVTGAQGMDLAGAAARAADLRARVGFPVAVGFGVKTPQDVSVVAAHADGVVVGTALVDRIAKGEEPAAIRSAVADLRAATRRS